jgi:hypothetical protein
MTRTAYHRAYYWSRLDARRASARASRKRSRERQAIIRIVCEAVTEARNDKPPLVGSRGLTWQGGCLTLKLHLKRDGSLTDCSSPVNHPTTPCSEMLVGETTRSIILNSDRGSGPLNAQRVVGKREPQRGNS